MATSPEVKISIIGDSSSFSRAAKQASDDAQKLESSLSDVTNTATRFNQVVGKGGADFTRYRSDLDGVGEGFNDLEDRAMGAGNLINGFSDVMKGGSQGTASFAMGLSDLAAGTRYTLVPSLQDGVKSVKGLTDRMKEAGGASALLRSSAFKAGAAITSIVAAVTAAALAWEKYQDKQQQAHIETGTSKFIAAGDSARAMNEEFQHLANQGLSEVIGTFEKLRETNPQAAQDFINTARAAGMSDEILAHFQETLNTTAAAEEKTSGATEDATTALEQHAEAAKTAEERIRGFYDAQQAAIDPLFNFTSAVRDNQDAIARESEAQQALNDAIAEHGPTSAEAAAAQRDLEAAHQEVATSALDLRAAQGELDAALQDGRVSAQELDGILAQLEASGYTSADAMTWLRGQIDALPSRTVTVAVLDQASGVIEQIRRKLDGFLVSYNVRVSATESSQTFGGRQAGGGVVPSYFQSGGINWNWGPGPRGTDTVPAWLTPGEMVLNDRQQANLFGMIDAGRTAQYGPMVGGWSGGGGPVDVRLTIDSGSNPVDRVLADVLRKNIRVEWGGNVQKALGYSR